MTKIIVGKHYPELDGIRGLAVIIIMLFHSVSIVNYHGAGLEGGAYILNRLIIFGQSGVDLFFVLSGFLITGILMETVCENNAIKKFYIRRSLRIFPLYFIALLFVIMNAVYIENRFPDLNEFLIHAFYLQNWTELYYNEFGLLAHTWSLAIEEQFYLIWPVLFLFCYKKSPFHAIVLCIVTILISVLAKGVFPYFFTMKITYTSTVSHMDSLIMGAFCSVVFKHYKDVLLNYWGIIFCVAYLSLAISLTIIFTVEDHWSFMIWGIMFASIFYSYLILRIVAIKKDTIFVKFLNTKFMGHIGVLSYGLYVCHYFVFLQVKNALVSVNNLSLLIFIIGSLVTYICALISYELYEVHFLKLKNKFAAYERKDRPD